MTTQQQKQTASLLTGFIDAPYYLNNKKSYKFFVSLFIGLVIFSFLTFIKPHPIQQIVSDLRCFAIITSITVTIVFLTYFFLIQYLFSKYFNNKNWTIGKHLLSFLFILISSSFINFNVNPFILKGEPHGITNYLDFFKAIISVGLFPMALYLFIDKRYGDYQSKLINKEAKASTLNVSYQEIKDEIINRLITVYSYNKKEELTFSNNELIYITSQSNYASFFLLKEGKVIEKILRKPLSEIEKELESFSNIKRFHKSYIINSNFINSISGNSRGYLVGIDYTDKILPISRKFTKTDLEKLL